MNDIVGTIESIQVGLPQSFDDVAAPTLQGKPWISGIVKHRVQGEVFVGCLNLTGDGQADRKHHGGPDKAVLAYAAGHYSAWRRELLQSTFTAGAFGENLTLDGCDESTCCIGDVWRIGDCVLQISQPRQPCWKLTRRWNIPGLANRVQQAGRTGWYLRVLTEGRIRAGLVVQLVERPFPELSVAGAHTVMHAQPHRPEDDLRLASCPALSASWIKTLRDRTWRQISPDARLRLEGDLLPANTTTIEPMTAENAELEMSIPDWLIEHPESLRRLEALGIDYICGGKSLATACRERGLDPRQTLADLKRRRSETHH